MMTNRRSMHQNARYIMVGLWHFITASETILHSKINSQFTYHIHFDCSPTYLISSKQCKPYQDVQLFISSTLLNILCTSAVKLCYTKSNNLPFTHQSSLKQRTSHYIEWASVCLISHFGKF